MEPPAARPLPPPAPATSPDRPVVVAVAADGSRAAVRWGAQEARVEGVGLRLVHAVALGPTPPGAASVLRDAVTTAQLVLGRRTQIDSELFHGVAAWGVLAVSRPARLLVVQRRAPQRGGDVPGIAAVPVLDDLVAAAPVPLVCVPEDWSGRFGRGVVTVGVESADCAPILADALLTAGSRGARLHVLHATGGAESDGGVLEREIRVALAGVTSAAVVDVTVEVVPGEPAAVLEAASRVSELVVLGRDRPGLGQVSAAVLRSARCPVLLPAAFATVDLDRSRGARRPAVPRSSR